MAVRLAPDDDDLSGLTGLVIPGGPGASYRLDKRLGVGGMSVAYFALLRTPHGECPTVIKIMRPWFVRQSGEAARTSVLKESVALGRLNEQVPSTPFVVRLIDSGTLAVDHGGVQLQLPWLAVEYVHGGAEGTTLGDRVASAVTSTGVAFDLARAARVLECLADGVSSMHEVGVVHRDLKPDNILCCGFGEDEMFKIADFGIARPAGVAATFGGLLVGTPGYAAPEQAAIDVSRIGAWTDVFALGPLFYFVLTGQPYFEVRSAMQAIAIVRDPARRSLLESPHLTQELRARPSAAKAIDAVLARTTAVRAEERPQDARTFAAMLMPYCRPDSKRIRASVQRVSNVVDTSDETQFAARRWVVRHQPGEDRVIRSVAWHSDGRCLAVTSDGLAFWDGLSWRSAAPAGLIEATGLRFVRQLGPGQWLIGGDKARVAVYAADGAHYLESGDDADGTYLHADGDMQDLAVLVEQATGMSPSLRGIAARRWIKPLHAEGIASVSAVARFDDSRWLVGGRTAEGLGFAALYEPLFWRLSQIECPTTQAFLTVAAQPDRGVGIVGGTEGWVVVAEAGHSRAESLDRRFAVSAVAVDAAGRCWAASAGRIWTRRGGVRPGWVLVWENKDWRTPMVSLFADVGVVIGMTADGGIVEGQLPSY